MEQKIFNFYFKDISIEDLINPDKYSNSADVINIINCIENTMKVYANAITYTQFRNIYGILQKSDTVAEIQKARPKIAYIHARLDGSTKHDGEIVLAKDLTFFIMEIIKNLINQNQIKPFHEFMETMVAFHKQYNTKNN